MQNFILQLNSIRHIGFGVHNMALFITNELLFLFCETKLLYKLIQYQHVRPKKLN